MPEPDASSARSGPQVLWPQWDAAANVRAVFTLRGGGVSAAPCDSLNVAAHVQDDPAAVAENRRRVAAACQLPGEPLWLTQVHANRVVTLASDPPADLTADAVVTAEARRVCAIQVADCIPVLFAAQDGSRVGAAHAGWRGLAAGVLENTVAVLGVPPHRLQAWIGPGIGQAHFEVGSEVRAALTAAGGAAATAAFTANDRGRWQCDLAGLVRLRLQALGLARIDGGSWCTFADAGQFFSHRRDGRSGRMAALIWRA